MQDRKTLSDLYVKRDANRRGVLFDGACVVAILVNGFATALGNSPSLHISAAAAFMFFSEALVLLHYHVRAVLRLSQ